MGFPFKCVGLHTRPNYPGIEELIQQIHDWMSQRGARLLAIPQAPQFPGVESVSSEEFQERVDMVLVLGGDGTFLRAGRLSLRRHVPILGVNLGRLGFLTEITLQELFPVLHKLDSGDVKYEIRHVLQARVKRDDQVLFEDSLINDAVVSNTTIARLIEIESKVNGNFLALFKADGLIIATPTGSTAYSLAAGGPIVFPTMEAVIMTPICPHSLNQRPLVVPDHLTISVHVQTPATSCTLTLDGQIARALGEGEYVELVRSPLHLTLIKSPFMSYFDILKSKLRWAEG